MTNYGQWCPISKATEILGEKWTLLIVRELILGTTRFADFQRTISKISPTILTKRLKMLEERGLIVKRRLSGQKGYEYRLTPCGKELAPLIETLAAWGMRWARGQMTDDELDVELLMYDMHRNMDPACFPEGETVLKFTFADLEQYKDWWLVISAGDVDLCTEDTGKDVDVYVTSDIRTMLNVYQGDRPLSDALDDESVMVVGNGRLVRSVSDWLALCAFADIRPAGAAENTVPAAE